MNRQDQFPVFCGLMLSDNIQERYWANECYMSLLEKQYNKRIPDDKMEEYVGRLEIEADIIKDIGEEVTIINDVSANVYDEITVEDYRKLSKIEQHKLIEKLEKQMKEAAKILDFEHAAFVRDRIEKLKNWSKQIEYSDENKIVALTENGCVFDIDAAIASNTKWAWFNTWSGEYVVSGFSYSEQYTEEEILKKAYDSEYVLTLDELPDLKTY